MATWQPPIPSGALYSRPARDLGPALALLAWCYDAVQRDGSFDVHLKEVAGELDEPYHTVVKWWAKLHSGPFFADIIDRGRSGFRVRFADEWIEWRVLSARGTKASNKFETPEMVTETQQPDTAIEEPEYPSKTPQKLFNDSSITAQLPEMTTEEKCIKEDMIQESRVSTESAAQVPTPTSKKKQQSDQEPPTPEVIRVALFDVCKIGDTARREIKLNANGKAKSLWKAGTKAGKTPDEIADAIRYVGSWCRLNAWQCKNGQAPTPTHIGDYWREAIDARQEHTNGQAHRNGVVSGSAGGEPSGDAANAAALERSGQRPERAPLRRATIDW